MEMKEQNDYQIVRLIGKGNTGEVFFAEKKGKKYAVKVGYRKDILQWEAEILQRINHKVFPAYEEYEEEKDWLIMEYIEGDTLQEILDGGKRLPMERVIAIMDEVLSGLHYLHIQKPEMIYRDMKPENIMIEKSGKVKIVDLGAVCYRNISGGAVKDYKETTIRVGTYGYGAPEQFVQGGIVDERCDIYGAGKLFAYLLTGKNPAHPPYDAEQLGDHMKQVPDLFQEIIKRSIDPDPQARFESAERMRREILSAYSLMKKRRIFRRWKKESVIYQKSIWLSEYRRIF